MQTAMVRKFFEFMNERHAIYLRRKAGEPRPWTKDPVLHTYRFTNVFRRLDRVTEFYMSEVYKPNCKRPNGELVFNTALFRAFNWPPTWGYLGGWQRRWGSAIAATKAEHLVQCHRSGSQLFTGAYMVRSTREPKPVYVLRCMTELWPARRELAELAADTQSIQATVEALMQYPLMGGFTAYEVVCDLTYTKLLVNARDKMTWANPGPGAVRGLNRLRGDDIKKRVSRDQCIEEMVALLERSGKRGGWRASRYYPLQLRDIEHSLCEFDKYCRGRTRSRYRPETRY